MATQTNEITLTASLSCNKPSIMANAIGRSVTGLLVSMAGNTYTENSVIVTTTAAVLPLGGITQPHYGFFSSPATFNNALTQPTTVTITGAANNGSGLVRITAAAHGYQTGDVVTVAAVAGTTEANGTWPITVITTSTFDLLGSAFSNGYTSGGTALLIPSIRLRNGATGADVAQLFIGQAAVLPLLVGGSLYAVCNMTGQALEYLILSY